MEYFIKDINGGELELSLFHTRYFQPVHRDGAPYTIGLEVTGELSTAADVMRIRFNPEQAREAAKHLLELADEAEKKNREELS